MIVTSFGQKGFHRYGKRFVEQFLERCPGEDLIVYYEKTLPRKHPKDDRLKYIDLYQFDDFTHLETLLKVSDPLYRGMTATPNGAAYNFRFDAHKFFRKVYAIVACAKTFGKDTKLCWLDADVVFKKDTPPGFFPSLFPEDAYIVHLGREWLYSENGFIGFDTSLPINNTFMSMWLAMYMTGSFKYLGEFHDCYSFDFLRTLLGIPCCSLVENEKQEQPFDHSILGQYMEHLKGPRKDADQEPEAA